MFPVYSRRNRRRTPSDIAGGTACRPLLHGSDSLGARPIERRGVGQLGIARSDVRLLRYRIDRVSLIAALAITAWQFYVYFTSPNIGGLLALLVALRWLHIIEHNHVHSMMFVGRRLNDLIGGVMSIGTGVPVELYRIHHVETHHAFENGPQDWTSPFSFSSAQRPDRPVNVVKYVVTFGVRGWSRSLPIALRRALGTDNRVLPSLVLFIACSALLLARDPQAFVAAYAVPWLLYSFAAGWANWRHHDGCDFEGATQSANVDTRLFSRALGFNIGYHSMHHIYPELHWSLLREKFDESAFADVPADGDRPEPRI